MSTAAEVNDNFYLYVCTYVKAKTGTYPAPSYSAVAQPFLIENTGEFDELREWNLAVPPPTRLELQSYALAQVQAEAKVDQEKRLAQTDLHKSIFAAINLLQQKNAAQIPNPVTEQDYENAVIKGTLDA